MTTETTTTELRRCIGCARFGIEAHQADASDFPTQPSQKDGLGRMCKPHWQQYTNALRRASVARKATQVAGIQGSIPDALADGVLTPETQTPRMTRHAEDEPELGSKPDAA